MFGAGWLTWFGLILESHSSSSAEKVMADRTRGRKAGEGGPVETEGGGGGGLNLGRNRREGERSSGVFRTWS